MQEKEGKEKIKEIHDYEPCPLYWMESRSGRNTICNDIRDIYHEAVCLKNDKIMNLARIAMSKSKAMMNKLQGYNKESTVELFPPKHDHG